ncbi:hypothetical protein B0T14DRAFT_603392 [Immersiella caudata]|uniref:Uncharacterized protein n=1 Tax=Immersiella caudata TaxID=314043 RepID=A0AA39WQH6_9PEZI|nr:hypothetical protein B0T14DRAFT_603392 [Immersiella caudata]
MMTASPSPLKGPRLTLLVNSTTITRYESSPKSGIQAPMSSILTPTSTTVEYGDGLADSEMSVTDRTNHIFKLWLNTVRDEPAESTATHGDVTPVIRKPRPINTKLPAVNERLSHFLQGLGQATGDPNKHLVQENQGLHKRVATLQRSEEHLLRDNQDLNMHVVALQESQEAQMRRFENELRLKQAPLEARIRELEEQVAHQNERLFKLTLQPKPSPVQAAQPEPTVFPEPETPAMSDADVAEWFATRSSSWASWADEFAHRNPNRMAELHPLQQQEILGSVKSFVRLTTEGKLPAALKANVFGPDASNVTRLLLQGMLANFIASEVLTSPFWILSALSKQGSELDSPRTNSELGTPIGYRMDYAMWSNTGLAPCPSPYSVPPAPTTARSIAMLSPRHEMPQRTPLHGRLTLPLNTKSLTPQYNLPLKPEMEDLLTLLMKATQTPGGVDSWRAQLMKLLSDGGLTQDPSRPSVTGNEERQILANAQRVYARELKERFLRSAARFFLHDQDAQGITKLEGKLASEIDLALRFCVQVWARPAPLTLLNPKAISTLAAADRSSVNEAITSHLNGTEGDQDLEVIMVLQPAVLLGNSNDAPVCSKALVVLGPKNQLNTIAEALEPPTPSTEPTLSLDLGPAVATKTAETLRPIIDLKPFIAIPPTGWAKTNSGVSSTGSSEPPALSPETPLS